MPPLSSSRELTEPPDWDRFRQLLISLKGWMDYLELTKNMLDYWKENLEFWEGRLDYETVEGKNNTFNTMEETIQSVERNRRIVSEKQAIILECEDKIIFLRGRVEQYRLVYGLA